MIKATGLEWIWNPYAFAAWLRKHDPHYKRIGIPKRLNDTSSFDELKKGKHYIMKTKAEIVDEYYQMATKLYNEYAKFTMSGAAGLLCSYLALTGGGFVFAVPAMLFLGWAVFWYWRTGATFSNWSQFEMRPLMVPVEDVSKENRNRGRLIAGGFNEPWGIRLGKPG